MLLSLLFLGLVRCGSGGGSSPAPEAPANPGNGGGGPPPIDYSTTVCGTVAECIKACEITDPYSGETTIRNDLCGVLFGTNSAACNSIVATNNANIASNTTCQLSMTDQVIDPAIIGTITCFASGLTCQNKCATLFPTRTLHDAETYCHGLYGTSGAALNCRYEQELNRQAYDSCLAAPSAYVMGI